MKKILFLGLMSLIGFSAFAQTSPFKLPSLPNNNPWFESDLIQPSALAANLKSAKAEKPIIFNIGAAEDIKGARHIGAVSEKSTLENFKKELQNLPKNTSFVFYCGCCPFVKCPNIRPAFNLVKSMGFTKAKLLNLPINLKTNWIGMGYPM